MCNLRTNGKRIFGQIIDKLQVEVHPYLEYFFLENKFKLHLNSNWAQQFRAEYLTLELLHDIKML